LNRVVSLIFGSLEQGVSLLASRCPMLQIAAQLSEEVYMVRESRMIAGTGVELCEFYR
jgi:hypothetical protein